MPPPVATWLHESRRDGRPQPDALMAQLDQVSRRQHCSRDETRASGERETFRKRLTKV
jgi:hypothetical protein